MINNDEKVAFSKKKYAQFKTIEIKNMILSMIEMSNIDILFIYDENGSTTIPFGGHTYVCSP